MDDPVQPLPLSDIGEHQIPEFLSIYLSSSGHHAHPEIFYYF